MKRVLKATLLALFALSVGACNSSSSSAPGEIKPLEGKRIPPGAGGGRGGPATNQKN